MEQEMENTKNLIRNKEEKEGKEKVEAKENDEEEEIWKMLMKMETPRKAEEGEERERQEELDRKIAQAFQEYWEKEDLYNRKRMEQESRDHELALHMNQNASDAVEEVNYEKKRLPLIRYVQEAEGKINYDLSEWKYSDLRDTINTSSDFKLLEASKLEFKHRLKVYHTWKSKNRNTMNLNDQQASCSTSEEETNLTNWKYSELRDTLNTSCDIELLKVCEIEVYRRLKMYHTWKGRNRNCDEDQQLPICTIEEGTDDMHLCRLNLDETGLIKERGAEILEHDFNQEQEKYGGKMYTSPDEESFT